MKYKSAQAAHRGVLGEIVNNGLMVKPVMSPTSITSGFGAEPKGTLEILGVSFSIENPRDRSVHGTNSSFARANFVWMLAGRDDHEWIAQYNTKGAGLAEVDGHYPGSHGRRMGLQLRRVVSLLREDPSSRRAQVLIQREEDLYTHNRDIPCVTSLQFFLRQDHTTFGQTRLDMVCHMRSQNANTVMPYDLFALTMLQECVANVLDVQLGTYHHLTGSMHIMAKDEMGIRERLKYDDTATTPMDIMPSFGPDDEDGRPEVSDLELLAWLLCEDDTDNLALDTYWSEFMGVMIAGRA